MDSARKLAVVAWIGLAFALGSGRALWAGHAEGSLEYPVKAAFLVNFAKFTEWPADSLQARAAAVSICVLGEDPFGPVLEKTASGRAVGGRPIVIQRYRSVEEVQSCHVLFIATSESELLPSIFEQLAGQHVLTVGERDGFARRGGVIGLVVEDNLARFEVNLKAAERSGLQISSKLLGLARMVKGPPAREQ